MENDPIFCSIAGLESVVRTFFLVAVNDPGTENITRP